MKKFCLLVLFFIGVVWAQADNPVSVSAKIYIVNQVSGQEELKEASQARPGQVVEYQITAVNNGDTTLPAGTVIITGPIPEGTTFVAESASIDSERLLTEYSVDGTTFSEEPVIVGDTTAEATAYQAVRWTLLSNMEPGQEETFKYRVTVDKN